jgi:putative tricarboxylic transport membrane protein
MGFDSLYEAAFLILNGGSLLFLMAGIVMGMLFGVIPGLGSTTALALLIPVTYTLSPLDAMYLAGGVMGAASFGGSITAILLNTPGTAPNAATVFDGYPMALQGRAGAAIGAAASASSLGGLLGLFTLLAFMPFARQIVLSFGPSEFFLLAVLGLTAIAISVRGKLLRGLIAGILGLMLAFVGADVITGQLRYTGGIDYLWDGIPLVPTLTGLFAISQMIELSLKGGTVSGKDSPTMKVTGVWEGIIAPIKHWDVLLRGSLIGTLIGAVPGLGGTVAAFLSYSSTAQSDKDPDSFGKGNIRGVIAPESANNAKDGGSLIPTVAFGIPGSAETAIFLAILVLHGMSPGPQILIENEREIYGLIVAMTISCVLASVIGLLLTRWIVLITFINVRIIVPIVVSVALTGVYVLEGRMADVVLTMVMGLIGYVMIRFDYPRLTLVIALVLGETAERSYHMVSMISDSGAFGFMLGRPISIVLILCIIGTFLLPLMRASLARRRKARAINT